MDGPARIPVKADGTSCGGCEFRLQDARRSTRRRMDAAVISNRIPIPDALSMCERIVSDVLVSSWHARYYRPSPGEAPDAKPRVSAPAGDRAFSARSGRSLDMIQSRHCGSMASSSTSSVASAARAISRCSLSARKRPETDYRERIHTVPTTASTLWDHEERPGLVPVLAPEKHGKTHFRCERQFPRRRLQFRHGLCVKQLPALPGRPPGPGLGLLPACAIG